MNIKWESIKGETKNGDAKLQKKVGENNMW